MGKKEIPHPRETMVGSALRSTHKAAERASKQQRSEEIGSEAAVMKKSTQGSSYPAEKEKARQLSRAEINVTWGMLQWQDLGNRREDPN